MLNLAAFHILPPAEHLLLSQNLSQCVCISWNIPERAVSCKNRHCPSHMHCQFGCSRGGAGSGQALCQGRPALHAGYFAAVENRGLGPAHQALGCCRSGWHPIPPIHLQTGQNFSNDVCLGELKTVMHMHTCGSLIDEPMVCFAANRRSNRQSE